MVDGSVLAQMGFPTMDAPRALRDSGYTERCPMSAPLRPVAAGRSLRAVGADASRRSRWVDAGGGRQDHAGYNAANEVAVRPSWTAPAVTGIARWWRRRWRSPPAPIPAVRRVEADEGRAAPRRIVKRLPRADHI